MTCSVLVYHSHNIAGSDYATNDHVALATDLAMLAARGARVISLREVAQRVRDGDLGGDEALIGLSFDDGPIFDVEDFVHPVHGPQKSFASILRSCSAGGGRCTPRVSLLPLPERGGSWR